MPESATVEETKGPSAYLRVATFMASELDHLVRVLAARGYDVVAPTVRDDAIAVDRIQSAAELPQGWHDAQAPGTYRVQRGPDGAYFGFATPAGTWKRFLFPPRTVLWKAVRTEQGIEFKQGFEPGPPLAFLGIRSCDLAAILVQDRVFVDGDHPDPAYVEARKRLLLIAINCELPAKTCFCTSMGTGPSAGPGADIVLTELDWDIPSRHRFLATAGTEEGAAVLGELTCSDPLDSDFLAAETITAMATKRIERRVDTQDLPQQLKNAAQHPHWDDIASRCLACGNCTLQCPTCFCTQLTDEPNAITGIDERVQEWSSCFEQDYSYIHGGSIRPSVKARYRQWLTHKMGTWWDQFGTSGCVGCGRCITWCPVGIDITAEIAELQKEAIA